MRCACVDIGSNTTRLLVAERNGSGLREVAAVREFLRLTPGDDGALSPQVVQRVAAVVADQVQHARRHGAAHVHAVATAAIRAASNRAALCRAVRDAAGIEVEILSGAEEAALAFAGATATIDEEGDIGVVDVGGGSSELVTGTRRGGVQWWASFPLGSGVLTDRHVRHDPPTSAELDAIRDEVGRTLSGLVAPRSQYVLAVGGSAASLQRLTGGDLPAEAFARALDQVTTSPTAEAARRLGLHVQRVRLLPAGLILLDAARRAFGEPALTIARGGLREGVVLRALDTGS